MPADQGGECAFIAIFEEGGQQLFVAFFRPVPRGQQAAKTANAC